jgi:hypothetical protein
MRLGLNIVTTFLHSLKPRKLISGSRNTYFPKIFARHNPRLAARAARLRASKSARSIRTSAAPSFTSTADGTGTNRRHRRYARSLRRSTTNAATVFPAPVPSYPQPPGAYACAPPNSMPDTTTMPDIPAGGSTPLVAQKVFFDELYKQRAVLMRAAEEQRARAEEDAEFLRLLAEDQRKAHEAHLRAEAEEQRLEEERRVKEEIELKERRRRRKREAEERRRRRAAREERREKVRLEQERLDQELLEWERLEQERREQERRDQERREREQEALRQKTAAEVTLAQQVAEWLRVYEEKWTLLRTDVQLRPLAFSDIPWPLFGVPASAEDITLVRVQEFLCHPQRESVQGAGLIKSLRSEMLRWHPDKFNAKMLNKVVEGEREAVMEAAGKVARFLTQLSAEIQGR